MGTVQNEEHALYDPMLDGLKIKPIRRLVQIKEGFWKTESYTIPTNLHNKMFRDILNWVVRQAITGFDLTEGNIYISADGYSWHKICSVAEFNERS